MRLSAGQLEEHVKGILEGVLLWASDSKNRFKLKASITPIARVA